MQYEFRLPDGCVSDDPIEIIDENGKTTHRVSANGIVELVKRADDLYVDNSRLKAALEAERARIRRLVAVLTEDLFPKG